MKKIDLKNINNIDSSDKFEYVAQKYPYTTMMSWKFYKHKHSFWEIIICIESSAIHYINDESYEFNSGDIIIMKPDSKHDYTILNKGEYYHYDFYATSENVKKILNGFDNNIYNNYSLDPKPHKFNVNQELKNAISQKLAFLNTIQQDENFKKMSDIIYKTLLNLFLGLAYEDTVAKLNELPQWFSQILSSMNSQEYIGAKVEDIVKMSGYSHGHLVKLFKKLTNKTLTEYFTKNKMDYACFLLKNKDLSILDISGIIGYDSLSHFIQIFKKYYNITPKQYRLKVYNYIE